MVLHIALVFGKLDSLSSLIKLNVSSYIEIKRVSWQESHQFCLNTDRLYYPLLTTDIDECQANTHGCEHSCHNYEGGFYCSCRSGYRLMEDSKSCEGKSAPNITHLWWLHPRLPQTSQGNACVHFCASLLRISVVTKLLSFVSAVKSHEAE